MPEENGNGFWKKYVTNPASRGVEWMKGLGDRPQGQDPSGNDKKKKSQALAQALMSEGTKMPDDYYSRPAQVIRPIRFF